MAPIISWWAHLVHVFDLLTITTWGDEVSQQHPMVPTSSLQRVEDYPIFDPPNGPDDGSEFKCRYPSMPGFTDCSTHDNRGCWLQGPDFEYNINTNYENHAPKGITRKYYLETSTMTLAPDGVNNTEGKVFNSTYPGPWIQACWGDDLEITVKNNLKTNGTTIHWHGIRQLNNVAHDGVNAITQCPIAPGESFTYKFKALQYGSSWYHSHYSLQYGDGLAGPMTIYGPSSAEYDTAKNPILMTDWNHRSAFEDWAWSRQPGGSRPEMTSILLNGIGQYPPTGKTGGGLTVDSPTKYEMVFQKGVRYLLRLINTSVDTTFVFAIDNHNLTVIQADFVPIEPYTNGSVLVGIGQRYHIIVEANPLIHAENEDYWIRTIPATHCESFTKPKPDHTTGILRYNPASPYDPITTQGTFDVKCSDETYEDLKPILKWDVGLDVHGSHNFSAGGSSIGGAPYFPERPMFRWDMLEQDASMWLDFSKPTVLHLDEDYSKKKFLVVEDNSEEDTWVELLIVASPRKVIPGRNVPPVAHPIHLHGHDFALLAQSETAYDPDKPNIKRDNPPRRDVALLPLGGYLIIAFKADNPGAWLMHCHIAWHASGGLALQILENKDNITIDDSTKDEMNYQCNKWDGWYNKQPNRHEFQDDSGI